MINWKQLHVTIGSIRIRLRTVIASAVISAIGILGMLDVYSIRPIIDMFVADDKRADFIMAVLGILFVALRSITSGPLWEDIGSNPEKDDIGKAN